MLLRLVGISPCCRNIGEFHVFATASWNVALLLQLARTCGTLQGSIYDTLWKRCRERQGNVLDKMRKEVVKTNVEHCKERSGQIMKLYLRFYAVGFRHVLSCSMVKLKVRLILGILQWCKCCCQEISISCCCNHWRAFRHLITAVRQFEVLSGRMRKYKLLNRSVTKDFLARCVRNVIIRNYM